MPVQINVNELNPGMRLADNIIYNYQIVLPHGHTLTEKNISFLAGKFPNESFPVDMPNLEGVVDFEDLPEKKISTKTAEELRQNMSSVSQKTTSMMHNVLNLSAEQMRELDETISEMLRFIQENPLTINILEKFNVCHEYLQSHGMNVLNYSLLLAYAIQDIVREHQETSGGRQISGSATSFSPLATAAIFHDIGMIPIQNLYDKTDPITEEEKKSIKAHPLVSVELLPDGINPAVLDAVLHHHENYDGTGYMKGIKGDELNAFARILRIADAFATATTNKAYGKSKNTITVLYEMTHGDYRNCYDPALANLFASKIQPFPIGAKIKLNNGQWAVVVRHNQKNPFKPQIIIAFDEQGNPLPKSQLKKPFLPDQRSDIEFVSFNKMDLTFLNKPIPDISLTEHYNRIAKTYREISDNCVSVAS